LGAYQPFYVPGAVLVVAGVAYHVLRALFQANLQSGAYARSEILFSVGRIVFSLAFVFLFWRDAVGLIVGPAVSYTLLVAVMVPWHRLPAAVRAHPRAFRLTLAPQFLRYGIPLIGWMIGVRILEMSDRYLIHYLRGPGDVGVYSANYGMASMAIWIVATPLLLTAHPLIFSSWESAGRQRVQELITLFSRYYLLAMAPLAALVVVFARDVAAVLLGESFRDGYTVVPVVFAGLLLWNFGFYGHKSLKVLEKTRVMLALVCVCVIVNIGLNLALIPGYGYMGAAIATLVAAGMYPVMVFAITRRLLAWRVPWLSLGRITLSAGLAGVAAAAAATLVPGGAPVARILVGLVVVTLVYVIMMRVTREVHSDEWTAIRNALWGMKR
jgi:O-antigen/teichoic acid export membrane protein